MFTWIFFLIPLWIVDCASLHKRMSPVENAGVITHGLQELVDHPYVPRSDLIYLNRQSESFKSMLNDLEILLEAKKSEITPSSYDLSHYGTYTNHLLDYFGKCSYHGMADEQIPKAIVFHAMFKVRETQTS